MLQQSLIEGYVGREEIRRDIADPERLERLAALLDYPWRSEDEVPPLGHFVLFRPRERQSQLGEDGHPRRDPSGMLPAIPLPRRMWAGSRIRFERPIMPGSELVRLSRLTSAALKSGKSGPMVFCTVLHEIREGEHGHLVITEEQDIVYREASEGSGVAPRPAVAPAFAPEHRRKLTVGPVELFRYSALTFNSHRIHYDRGYARDCEGYQGLVVHGPFLATLLFHHLVLVAPGRRILEFNFRAVSPSFEGEELTFGATVADGSARLSVEHSSGLALSGDARLA